MPDAETGDSAVVDYVQSPTVFAPKPCRHPVAQHQHGTYVCYVADGCRCWPCSAACHGYDASRQRQQAYGRWNGLIDADPVRRHVQALIEYGIGLRRVASLAGVSPTVVVRLVRGPAGSRRGRIRPETAARLLAVQPIKDNLADGHLVDGTGTRRRLQALVALGWSQSQLATYLGMGELAVRRNATTAGLVRRGVERAVRQVYDTLWNQPPPESGHRSRIAASRARNLARARGWVSPLAWDDATIDDPAAEPQLTATDIEATALDEIAIARAVAGDPVRLTSDERDEAVRRLVTRGSSARQVSELLGVSQRTVERVLARIVCNEAA